MISVTLNDLNPADVQLLTDEELLALQQQLMKRNEFLDKENRLFESYFARVNPTGTAIVVETVDDDAGTTANPKENQTSRREKKKRGEKVKEAEKLATLSAEQKAEIASRELEELKDEKEREKTDWEKVIDSLKAEMEETEIRIDEVKKTLYEFKREIVQQSVNVRTGNVMAEKVIRYFEDRIRSKDALIEKTRLKNATLKVQKNKLLLQLKQKEEMGEVLHAIDFDQLKIENEQYLARIEERNNELLKLKLTAGNTVQVLNAYKKKLNALTQESAKLKCEIKARQDLLTRLGLETEIVNDEREKAFGVNKAARKEMEDYRVPPVLDYVKIKANQQELVKKEKNWQRKVEIAEMGLTRVRKLWEDLETESKARTLGWQPIRINDF